MLQKLVKDKFMQIWNKKKENINKILWKLKILLKFEQKLWDQKDSSAHLLSSII